LVALALFWLEFTEDEDREALKSWEAQNIYQTTQDCDYQLFKFAFALITNLNDKDSVKIEIYLASIEKPR
jgi:hypothetical protein